MKEDTIKEVVKQPITWNSLSIKGNKVLEFKTVDFIYFIFISYFYFFLTYFLILDSELEL